MFLFIIISFYLYTFAVTETPDIKAIELLNEKKFEYSDEITNQRYFILIDYSKSILQKRLWLYDTQKDTVVIHCYVSHAFYSGIIYASDFSNQHGSNKTPKGAFITGDSYNGKFGYSMRLHGLEKGINEHSYKRYITFHPCCKWFWSEGCFMTDRATSKKIIDLTKNGSFMYVYAKSPKPILKNYLISYFISRFLIAK